MDDQGSRVAFYLTFGLSLGLPADCLQSVDLGSGSIDRTKTGGRHCAIFLICGFQPLFGDRS
jgi:hypothetical protein